MAQVLIVIASGPEHAARAREGLLLAQAMHVIGMIKDVRVLLTGPGVRALDAADPDAEALHEVLEALLRDGVPVEACTRSLADHRLIDALGDLEAVRPVGAPVQLSQAILQGATVLTF